MSEHESRPEKIRQKRDLVELSKDAIQKIDRWIEQINAKKSVDLSRKSFLSWYIENCAENLSNAEVNEAIDRFYDPETHLRKLLRDVRKAKANGEGDGVEVVLKARKGEARRENVDTPEAAGSGAELSQADV